MPSIEEIEIGEELVLKEKIDFSTQDGVYTTSEMRSLKPGAKVKVINKNHIHILCETESGASYSYWYSPSWFERPTEEGGGFAALLGAVVAGGIVLSARKTKKQKKEEQQKHE